MEDKDKKPEKIECKGETYLINEEVRLYTGNADGSIPSVPNYRGKILKILPEERVLIRTKDDGNIQFHIDRLRKLEEKTNNNWNPDTQVIEEIVSKLEKEI